MILSGLHLYMTIIKPSKKVRTLSGLWKARIWGFIQIQWWKKNDDVASPHVREIAINDS